MSRRPHHSTNPHTRRILCQRCHKNPATHSILTRIRLCDPCQVKTFNLKPKPDPKPATQLTLLEEA